MKKIIYAVLVCMIGGLMDQVGFSRAEMALTPLRLQGETAGSCEVTYDIKAFEPCAACHATTSDVPATKWFQPTEGEDLTPVTVAIVGLLQNNSNRRYVSPEDNYFYAKVNPSDTLGHGGGKEFDDGTLESIKSIITTIEENQCLAQDPYTIRTGEFSGLSQRGRLPIKFGTLRSILLSLVKEQTSLIKKLNDLQIYLGWSDFTAKENTMFPILPDGLAYLDQVLAYTCELRTSELGDNIDDLFLRAAFKGIAVSALGVTRVEAAELAEELASLTKQDFTLNTQRFLAGCYILLRSPKFILR